MRSALAAITISLTCIMGSYAIAADTDAGTLARGGRLYDRWYEEAKAETPTGNHVSWPASNSQHSGEDTFRCKSCHGWDLLGKDGAYATGSWATGIKGVNGMAGKDPAAIVAVLKDAKHGFGGAMPDADLMALAVFVSKGRIDMDPYIDRATKKAKGDVAAGARIYETACAICHGANGKGVKDADHLGVISNENPWETIHKISFGPPGEQMPAFLVFGPKVAGDLLAYLQTLPNE